MINWYVQVQFLVLSKIVLKLIQWEKRMKLADYQQLFPNISEDTWPILERWAELLREWNTKINLISRKDIDALEARHLVHCLAITNTLRNTYFKEQTFFEICWKKQKKLAGGRCPPDPLVFGWGDFAPPDPPLKRSSAAFDRGGQTGPPRSIAFSCARLTITVCFRSLMTRLTPERTILKKMFFLKKLKKRPDSKRDTFWFLKW